MTVMFPIITNKFNKNEPHENVLLMSISLVAVGSLAISLFYFLFPEFTIILFLKRTEYLAVENYLGFFGIFISLYSIVSLFSYYFLSIKKTKIAWFLVMGAIFQAVSIYFYHSNFLQIILISITTMGILLLSFLYYSRLEFWHLIKK